MSDSDINSRSSHRSRLSSRSDEILKAIKEMNKKQAEDQEKKDQQQKEFQEIVSSSIRELGSKVEILNEELQEMKSKSSSSSRKSESKIPEEVGPVVEFESMIESDDELVRGILSNELGLGLALDAIKTSSWIDALELPAGVTDRRNSRSSIQTGKAISFSPTWQSSDLLEPGIADPIYQLGDRQSNFEFGTESPICQLGDRAIGDFDGNMD